MLFASPPEHTLEWSDSGVEGCSRFLKRFWRFAYQHRDCASAEGVDAGGLDSQQEALRRKLHETIQKAGRVVEQRHTFNTAIAANMELLNDLMRLSEDGKAEPGLVRECLEAMLRMLAPAVPHLTHVLWHEFGFDGVVLDQPWPEVDESALRRSVEQIVVQVNGKGPGANWNLRSISARTSCGRKYWIMLKCNALPKEKPWFVSSRSRTSSSMSWCVMRRGSFLLGAAFCLAFSGCGFQLADSKGVATKIPQASLQLVGGSPGFRQVLKRKLRGGRRQGGGRRCGGRFDCLPGRPAGTPPGHRCDHRHGRPRI